MQKYDKFIITDINNIIRQIYYYKNYYSQMEKISNPQFANISQFYYYKYNKT